MRESLATTLMLPLEPDSDGLKPMGEKISTLLAEDPERVIHVRADETLPYGQVMALLGKLGAQGASRLSLLTEKSQP